ncbi:hypothetical protein GTY20_09145 [Streptomyces sp. SID4946]|nr:MULTISPECIES: hypothetical protein [unclassified Streptomyces]MYQ91482.1 hypothetical protein [Streptomyces sp. SID4946]SCF67829.1 hypothetical protein GA0115256_111335 [Streptomyces sp. DconLS]
MTATMATAEASDNSLSRRAAMADGAAVYFTEERTGVIRTYDLAVLPMPHWHDVLARAFTAVLNLGAIRTLKSADAAYWPIGRFLTHLQSLEQGPHTPTDLTPEHLNGYYLYELRHTTQNAARTQMWQIGRLLRHVEPATTLSIDMRAYLAKARQTPKIPAQVAVAGNPLVLQFTDHDGVTFDFDFATLPFPAWHATLADAFTAMLQAAQGNSRRTAQRPFDALRRFLTGLEALPQPPATLGELTVEHLEDFHRQVRAELAAGAQPILFTSLRRLLMHISPYEQLSTELRHRLEQITYQPEGPAPTTKPARPGTGRTSVMPDGPYEAPASREEAAQTLKVHFTGEDGRTFEYDISKLRHPPSTPTSPPRSPTAPARPAPCAPGPARMATSPPCGSSSASSPPCPTRPRASASSHPVTWTASGSRSCRPPPRPAYAPRWCSSTPSCGRSRPATYCRRTCVST